MIRAGSLSRIAWSMAMLLLPLGCGDGKVPTPRPSPTPGSPGRFVYVAGGSSRDVSSYAIDPATGGLTPVGVTGVGGSTPIALAADPGGRYLWAATSGGEGGIRAFAVDRATGALREIAGSPFESGQSTEAIAIDPAGRYLFATRFATQRVDVLAIDDATGSLRAVPGAALTTSAPAIARAAITSDRRFLYVPITTPSVVDAATLDTTTGRLTRIGSPTSTPDVPACVTPDPAAAFLYVATATPFSSDTLFAYAIDARSGALTRVSGPALDPAFDAAAANFRPACVTFLSNGRVAYVADRPGRTGAGSRGYFAFPPQASGRLGPSTVGPFTTEARDPAGLTLDPSGRFAYIIDNRGSSVSAFAIDAASGALSPVGVTRATGLFPLDVVAVP